MYAIYRKSRVEADDRLILGYDGERRSSVDCRVKYDYIESFVYSVQYTSD